MERLALLQKQIAACTQRYQLQRKQSLQREYDMLLIDVQNAVLSSSNGVDTVAEDSASSSSTGVGTSTHAQRLQMIEEERQCDNCGEPTCAIADSSSIVCSTCGYMKEFIDATQPFTDSIERKAICVFKYSRSSHLDTHLKSLQALSSIKIDQKTVQTVAQNIYVHEHTCVTSGTDITITMVRKALKRLKLNKLYKHTTQVHYLLTGIAPVRLTTVETEKVMLMFEKLSETFDELLASGEIASRTNFMSYPYALYKIFQLLGGKYVQLSTYIVLLQCKKKRKKQFNIWKKLVNKLNWRLIDSL